MAGVPDLTAIPDIDETGINRNLKVRYERDEIYVSLALLSFRNNWEGVNAFECHEMATFM